MDEERERRLAQNEALAREVNDRVEEVAANWHTSDETFEIVCECSREDCSERLRVTGAEYAQVRADEHRFLVFDEHVNEEIERRVGTAGTATIVEKIGAGRDVVSRPEE